MSSSSVGWELAIEYQQPLSSRRCLRGSQARDEVLAMVTDRQWPGAPCPLQERARSVTRDSRADQVFEQETVVVQVNGEVVVEIGRVAACGNRTWGFAEAVLQQREVFQVCSGDQVYRRGT